MEQQPGGITWTPNMHRSDHDRNIVQFLGLISQSQTTPDVIQQQLLLGMYQVLLDIRDQLAEMKASADAMMGPE